MMPAVPNNCPTRLRRKGLFARNAPAECAEQGKGATAPSFWEFQSRGYDRFQYDLDLTSGTLSGRSGHDPADKTG
jgi:hypothetical protein